MGSDTPIKGSVRDVRGPVQRHEVHHQPSNSSRTGLTADMSWSVKSECDTFGISVKKNSGTACGARTLVWPPPPLKPRQHRGKITALSVFLLHEFRVKRHGACPHGRVGIHGFGRLLAQAQVLEHQVGGESGFVVVVRGAGRTDTGR